jgi:hypothetical protein
MEKLNINKEQFQPKKVATIISSLKSEVIDSGAYQKQAQKKIQIYFS